MSEEQRFGDGQDNYLQGMRQAAEAARESAASYASSSGLSGLRRGSLAPPPAAPAQLELQAPLRVRPRPMRPQRR